MGHRILYDADCGFCRWSLAWILRWDRHRRLRPLALQDPGAASLLAGMSETDRMASWHLVDPGGRITSGGAAAVPLLRLLPGGRPLAAIAARAPRLIDRGYLLVARNRAKLSPRISASAKSRADRVISSREAIR